MINQKIAQVKKEIEKCKECYYIRDMTNIKPALCNYHQGEIKGIQEANEMIEKTLDEIGIELFLEDVIDKKTGKKIKVPKEIKDLWDIYWEHIKEKIKSKLGMGK